MKRAMIILAALLSAASAYGGERAEISQVFDELAMPETTKARFVVFNTGAWWSSGGGKEFGFQYSLGWLLSESEAEVEILQRNLTVRRYSRDPELPEIWEKFRDKHPEEAPLPGQWKEIGWEEFTDSVLKGGVRDYFGALDHLTGGGLEHPVEVSLFAYWAHRRGETEQAEKLFALAEDSGKKLAAERREGNPTLAEIVRKSVATNVRWRAIEAANRGEERAKLLERWKILRQLVGDDPKSDAAAKIRHYESLLADDREFVERSPEELAKMPPEERAKYWFFKLRDVAERPWSQPGSVRILGWGDTEETKTAANRLVDLGWDALLALVEGVGDERPTRSMGFWRNFAKDTYHLMTIDQASRELIWRISDRFLVADTREAARVVVRGWLAEFRKKGRAAYLIEAVSRGDASGVERARTLVDLYPDEALAAIEEGARRARSAEARTKLVWAASRLPGEDSTRFLAGQMVAAPDRKTRITAARCLRTRGDSRAIPHMIGELEAIPDEECGVFKPGSDLFYTLVRIEDTRMVAAFVEALGRLGVDGRFSIVSQYYSSFRPPDCEDVAYVSAMEDLLAGLLEDTEARDNLSWGQDVNLSDPRICDVAAQKLANCFPDRYEFDAEAVLQVRERQLVLVQNAWLRARGRPEIEVPPEVRIEPLDPDLAKMLLDQVVKGTGKERNIALERLRLKGLPALSAVLATLEKLPDGHSARDGLAVLTADLARIVRECRFTKDSHPATGKLIDVIREQVGKPITSVGYLTILHTFITDRPEAIGGINLMVERIGDGTGVLLTVTLIERTWPEPKPVVRMGELRPDLMSYRHWVKRGDRALRNSSGAGGATYEPNDPGTEDFQPRLERAFDGPPGVPFEARVHLVELAGDR